MLQLPVDGKSDEYNMIPFYIVKKGKEQPKPTDKKQTSEEEAKAEDKPVDLDEVKLESAEPEKDDASEELKATQQKLRVLIQKRTLTADLKKKPTETKEKL